MLITRVSMLSGEEHTLDLPVTDEQLQRYSEGEYLQDAFPHLPAPDREFIKTGITPQEWEAQFGPPDPDPEEN